MPADRHLHLIRAGNSVKRKPLQLSFIYWEANMSLLSKFLQRRKFSKAQAHAGKISSLIAPYINVTGKLAYDSLRKNIKFWDLTNQTLVSYLGYVAGVIDAADNSLGHSSAEDWTATEIVFHQVIEAQLDWIDGSEAIIKIHNISMESDGSMIGGLQQIAPHFLTAMQLGGVDFLSTARPGFFPKGLFDLGLLTGGESS